MFVQFPVMTYDDYSKAYRMDGDRVAALDTVGIIEPETVRVANTHVKLCRIHMKDGTSYVVATTLELFASALTDKLISVSA